MAPAILQSLIVPLCSPRGCCVVLAVSECNTVKCSFSAVSPPREAFDQLRCCVCFRVSLLVCSAPRLSGVLSELKPGFLQKVFSRIRRRVHDNLIPRVANRFQCSFGFQILDSYIRAQVRGFVLVPVKAFNRWYELKMGGVQELCADLILGQDFLKRHKSATFLLGGPLKAIEVNQCNTCGVAAADIQPSRLFQFLDPKIRPIATPSRRFNLVDMQFIRKEVEKLLHKELLSLPGALGALRFL